MGRVDVVPSMMDCFYPLTTRRTDGSSSASCDRGEGLIAGQLVHRRKNALRWIRRRPACQITRLDDVARPPLSIGSTCILNPGSYRGHVRLAACTSLSPLFVKWLLSLLTAPSFPPRRPAIGRLLLSYNHIPNSFFQLCINVAGRYPEVKDLALMS